MLRAIKRPAHEVARGAHMFDIHNDGGWLRIVTLTDRGLTVLCSLGSARHVYGPEVRVVRKLVDTGLATLRDDGLGPIIDGRVDGERWTAEPTEVGAAVVAAAK